MNIKELENKCLRPILYSVYGNQLCGDTLQDLLSNMVAYINECIKQTNDNTILVNNLNEWIRNQGLKEEVIKQLNVMINNGVFETIINQEVFGDLSGKVDTNTNNITVIDKKVTTNTDNISLIKTENIERDRKINLLDIKTKGFVTLEELGAKGDGVTDDLHALDKAMQLMLQGSIKKVIGNGVYAISDTFHIDNKNNITFDIDTIKPTNDFRGDKYLISVGSITNGSMANVNLRMNLLEGQNKASGLSIKGCGSSMFDIKTIVNCKTGIEISNPRKISSDNLLIGNNIRQCDFGIVLRSEEQSACEGTIINYNFIYDCKYSGILLGKGSHYTDIRGALDFNGKYSMILELNDVNGLNRYDTLTVGNETVSIIDIFGNSVFVSGSKNVDKGNTNFKKSVVVSGKTIQNVITTNTELNVFLDIVNTNTKSGFSRNIITCQYCGGIYGDKNSINTDFIISYRTGKNENINLQGFEVATSSEGIKFIEGRTSNKLFDYKSQEKVIEFGNTQISGTRQNNVLPASASNHPIASIADLSNGMYTVSIIAQGRSDFAYHGILVKNNSDKTITQIVSKNIGLTSDGTDLLKASNGSSTLSPTVGVFFTRIASY